MNYNNTYHQKTAGIIRYSCALLFMLFTFCYLYFLQGEILAEAQFVYSHGITTYNILVGAIIITGVLQIVQWVMSLITRLPAWAHALTYIPSMLLLAILTALDRDSIACFSFGAWVWIAPLVLFGYILLAILANHITIGHDEDGLFHVKSQVYPNYIILFILILCVGAIPKSTDVYHFELKTERLILEGSYADASSVGQRSLFTSPRLTQLRMYALSKQGQLAERIFDYPQYYGSRGLLDVTDTLPTYRFSPQRICHYLGAHCHPSIHSANRFYQLLLADSLWNENTVDYYLCSLLLDKKLNAFCRELPRYYNLSDTIPHAYDGLPRAYREALLTASVPAHAIEGKIVIGSDTLATLADAEMIASLHDYMERKKELTDPTERANRTHREFGHTYWWYYDYQELQK